MDYLREVLLVLLLVTWEVDGLKCACDDCKKTRHTDFCTIGDNGRCFTRLVRLSNNSYHLTRHCYQPIDIHWCGTNNSNLVIECCNDKDYCNDNLYPTFPPTLNTALPPPVSTNSPSTTVPTPTLVTDIMCYQYNPNKPSKGPFCLTKTGSCYKLQRFASNGSLVSERQGCSKTCVEEKRNRKSKQCCNTSLCNAFSWQVKPTPTRLPSDNSEILKLPIVSGLLSSNKVESASSKVSISSQSLLASSISTTTPTAMATTTTTRHLTETPIIAITSPTLSLSYKSSLFSSPLLVILSIFVCIIYIILLILLFILVVILCLKQKKLHELKTTKSSNKTSLDTLTSGESV